MAELANGEPVAHGDRRWPDERDKPRIKHVALDLIAADGVRAVEHHERQLVLRRGVHDFEQRRNVGIRAGADVLDVIHQRVNAREHRVGRARGLAVEAVDRQPCSLVHG